MDKKSKQLANLERNQDGNLLEALRELEWLIDLILHKNTTHPYGSEAWRKSVGSSANSMFASLDAWQTIEAYKA